MLRPSMLFGVAVLTASACGPTPTVDAPLAPAASISVRDTANSPEATRAGWRYHPTEMSEILDGAPLPDGSWLLVGELGERWRTDPLPRQTEKNEGLDGRTYFARATIHRAPERINRIVRWSARRWLFVGESGTIYNSSSALGPLTASVAPPVNLHQVAGSAQGLVSIDSLGQLYRYDGATWSAPQGGPGSGCTTGTLCRRLFDVAATNDGKLLALAIPEQLLSSDDGGKSWTVRDGDPFGAGRLLRSVAGEILIEGPHLTKRWTGSGDLTIVKDSLELKLPTEGHLALLPSRGPSTSAIEERRAAFSGARYYEVFADPENRYLSDSTGKTQSSKTTGKSASGHQVSSRPKPWLLASGRIDRPLSVKRLDLTTPAERAAGAKSAPQPAGAAPECEALRLAARDAAVVIACMRDPGPTVIIDLYRSADAGKSFAKVGTLAGPDDDLSLAVAADGSILVAGACLSKTPADRQGGRSKSTSACEPRAPILFSARRGSKPRKSVAGDLTDRATSVAWSLDGERAYLFGRRAKDERIALFVSRDRGKTFSSRPLIPPKGAQGHWDTERDAPRTLHPGTHGELGMVLGSHPPAYAVADPDGRITSVARLPDGVAAVSGHGRFIFALGPNPEQDDGPLTLAGWESADAGLSFRKIGLPMVMLVDELDEPMAVECAFAGCVISSRLTRIGWNQPAPQTPVTLTPHRGPAPAIQPAVQTPIACSLDDKRGWTTVDNVFEPVLPAASHAMRGSSVWSTLRYDDEAGEVTALTLSVRSNNQRLSRQPLLSKVRDRARYGYYVSRQMEGYAAARVGLPKTRSELAGHPIKLDVGWTNYQTDTQGKATVDQLGALVTADVTPGTRPHLVAGLLSVSPKGLFVRPSATRSDTVVVDLMGKVTHQSRYPAWPTVNATASHSDAVLVGASALAVGMFASDQESATTTVAFAKLGASSGSTSFFRFAPEGAYDRFVGTWWSYQGNDVGMITHVIDVVASRGYATFTPFTAAGQLGAPVAVPTQLDLPTTLAPCSQAERQSTPRVNAPFAPGTRHPVLVQTSVDSRVLLTDRAILHGTPEAPCVAAFHARELRRPDQRMVAIIAGDLKRAWLFRETPAGKRSLDYRPMRCALSPGAAIPAGVWQAPGTVRR